MKLVFLSGLFLFLCSGVSGTMSYELIALEKTDLADKVALKLEKELHLARFRTFADGEINVELSNPEQFTGKTAVIIQSTGQPVNAHLLGVSFLAQELKNAGTQKVIAVIPYFGYSRQERSNIEGKPGHAAVAAKLLEGAGADELITVELHNKKLMDFFSIPVFNLSAQGIISQEIEKRGLSHTRACLVAPDKGAAEYVNGIGARIGFDSIIFAKERLAADQTRIVGMQGSCKEVIGIVIDDIIATGGTVMNVCNTLPSRGYEEVMGYFVHPVFAGPALERIATSCISQLFVSNTLPLSKEAQNFYKIKQFDVSPIIVEALKKQV